jgi:NADPH:quinone reductase and related Zn-dependent oxidoreductases
MKAIVFTKYGTPDVLELKEIDKPIPKEDEVLIKVYAVSINDWDLGLLQGDLINRLLNGLLKPKIKILGSEGLRDKGQIQSGQKLLINGAGGGVGTFAVQIAKLYGVEVTGVDSSGKLDVMRSMGFDHVINYKQEDFTKNGKSYDLILDVKTNRSIFDYTRVLSRNGIYVTVGGSLVRLLQALFLRPWISMISKKKICFVALKSNKDLDYMNELFETGKVKPVIDGPYRIDEVPKALRLFGEGTHKGKVVITVEHNYKL